MYKNCDKCSQINNVNDQFCIRCGNILTSEASFLKLYASRVMELERLSDRYSILKTIKSGGMGTIFMGIDKNLGKVCAIKELMLRFSAIEGTNEASIEMFEQEAKLLSSLNHGSLPRVYDYFAVNGKYYLIMDYIVGDDLLTIMSENNYDRGFPEEQVIDWAIQICDVLSYLHNRQPPIIYRDLKPANIMIKKADNTLVLIDFGIAVSMEKDSSSLTEYATIGYASPEQCAGKPCDVRSDIYSLGSTMYHLITGVRPDGFSLESPKKINPEISFYMNYILTKAIELKIKDRYQSADELKNSLLLWKDPFSAIHSDRGLSATDLLILQLKSNDRKTRIQAVKSLSGVVQEKATIALTKLLYEHDVPVQKQAAMALGEIGDNIAIDGLLNLLKSDEKILRLAAAESLQKIRFPDDEYIVFSCIKNLFSHRDSPVRLLAFSLQSKFKYESFYSYLFEGLRDEDHNIRRLCAVSLSEWGRPDAINPIKKAIEKEGLFSLATKSVLQKALIKLRETINKKQQEAYDMSKSYDYSDGQSNFKTSELSLPEQFKDTKELSPDRENLLKTGELSSEYTPPSETREGLLQKYREKVQHGEIKVSKPLFSSQGEENVDKKTSEKNDEQKFILKKSRKEDLSETAGETKLKKSLKKKDASSKAPVTSQEKSLKKDTKSVLKMKLSAKDRPLIEAVTQLEDQDKEKLLDELSVKTKSQDNLSHENSVEVSPEYKPAEEQVEVKPFYEEKIDTVSEPVIEPEPVPDIKTENPVSPVKQEDIESKITTKSGTKLKDLLKKKIVERILPPPEKPLPVKEPVLTREEVESKKEKYKSLIQDVKPSSKKKEESELAKLKRELEEEKKQLEDKKKRDEEERKRKFEELQKEKAQRKAYLNLDATDYTSDLKDKKLLAEREKIKEELEEDRKRLKEKRAREEELKERIIVKEEPLNCWEFTLCGKQALCPAYPKRGRRCAHTVGNIDEKKPRGPLASTKNCATCLFFNSEHYEKEKD
jgi:serine/threonine protein kinase